MMLDNELPLWVVYRHPADYPNNYVARLYYGMRPQDQIIVESDLDTVREKLAEKGLVMITRSPDDPKIVVETWL